MTGRKITTDNIVLNQAYNIQQATILLIDRHTLE